MTLRYGKFEMPQRISVEAETRTFARFIAEPFERGFGHTLGSAMRRMMLSCLESHAIIAVRMEHVPHEYMAIEGMIEDMTHIILNLKGALLKKSGEGEGEGGVHTVTATIDVSQEDLDKGRGQVKITLGDLIKEGIFEVVNPELLIVTVTKPLKRRRHCMHTTFPFSLP